MAQIGLSGAARLTGKNQSTIHRAMKTGRLSYSTDSAGKRVVDTAELDRVFGIKTVAAHDSFDESRGSVTDPRGNGAWYAHAAKSNAAHEGDMHIARGEHAALERLLADREASIADLRRRLDASEAERRQLSERLHGVLTPPDRKQEGALPLPPDDLKPSRLVTVSDPPAAVLQDGADPQKDAPSARAGLAIPRPPWWRRWVR